MSISVLTIQDKKSLENGLAKNLVNSLADQKCELKILDTYDPSLGLLSKIFKLLDYLEERKSDYADDDIIVFVDAHDMIFRPQSTNHVGLFQQIKDKILRSRGTNRVNLIQQLKNDFIKSGLDYIVAAEVRYAHQLPELKAFYDDYSQEPSRYVNTGFQVAYYSALIEIYTYLKDNAKRYWFKNMNDQGLIGQFFVDQTVKNVIPNLKIGMDHTRKFVSTLNSKTEFYPDEIQAYFIHVTWLENPEQLEKFEAVLKHYRI
jgi:hypothetical protein